MSYLDTDKEILKEATIDALEEILDSYSASTEDKLQAACLVLALTMKK